MAIVQTNKALNMASKIVNAADKFMAALEDLQDLEDERVASGLTLVNFDTDYAASGDLQHIDGVALNDVINTSIPAIITFMTGANHDDNLQKVRP